MPRFRHEGGQTRDGGDYKKAFPIRIRRGDPSSPPASPIDSGAESLSADHDDTVRRVDLNGQHSAGIGLLDDYRDVLSEERTELF
jgi:hypothetical protein